MNFVAAWMTRSAPSLSGCCSSGVANVLSTTTRVPALRGAAQMAATSAVSSSGLVGDSSHSRSASSARAIQAAVSAGANRSTRQPWSRAPASAMPGDGLVAVVGDHEVRARRQLAQDRGGRGHAGGERDRAAALQAADHGLERLPGLGALAAAVEALGAEHEVRRRHQRRVQRRAGLTAAAADDGPRLGLQNRPSCSSGLVGHEHAARALRSRARAQARPGSGAGCSGAGLASRSGIRAKSARKVASIAGVYSAAAG